MRKHKTLLRDRIADGITLSVFEIHGDVIIKMFRRIITTQEPQEAAEAYMIIIRTLLRRDTTLSDYLRDLLITSDTQLLYAFRDNRDVRLAVVEDLERVNELLKLSPRRIIKYMYHRYGYKYFLRLPLLKIGEFPKLSYFIGRINRGKVGRYAASSAFEYCDGVVVPVEHYDRVEFGKLSCDVYEHQRDRIVANTMVFTEGGVAQNVLLYGDRGTGKSTIVKALPTIFTELKLVQLHKRDIENLTKLYGLLTGVPHYFIIFIDDLTFGEDDESFSALKQGLEGGLTAKPKNVLVYATTNRRKLIREKKTGYSGDLSAAYDNTDELDENASLIERFGLLLTFSVMNKDEYLKLVRDIAAGFGVIYNEKVEQAAEAHALRSGKRTPRTAKRFVELYAASE